MLQLTPLHLQIAGIVLILAMGAALIWWVSRIVIGWNDSRPVYFLPAPDDGDDDGADDGGGDEGGSLHHG